jgi:hypothetical protein
LLAWEENWDRDLDLGLEEEMRWKTLDTISHCARLFETLFWYYCWNEVHNRVWELDLCKGRGR